MKHPGGSRDGGPATWGARRRWRLRRLHAAGVPGRGPRRRAVRLAVGLMILPAGIARFWSRDITGMMMIAVASAAASGYAGLILSFHSRVPAGPAIILAAAAFYLISVLFGPVGGLVRRAFPGRHLEA